MKPRFTIAIFNIAAVFTLCVSFARADALRGTLVSEESIRVAPDSGAAKLAEVGRGRELVIIDSSRDWIHVEAILRQPSHAEDATEDEEEGKAITGWVPARAVVTSTTQDGDRIIFGEAADSEDAASSRRGRRDAAQDAMQLYYPRLRFDADFAPGCGGSISCGRYSLANRAGGRDDPTFRARTPILHARSDE